MLIDHMHAFDRVQKMKLLIILCVLLHITSFNSVVLASDENDQSEQNSPLHEAVLDDNYVNVKKLINKGADKNAKNYFGRTPLHLAAKRGFEDIIKLLIDSHAEIDVEDNYGKIPLHFAAQNGHFEIFKMLVQECENRNIEFTNATDIMGMSLLHFAAMNRKPNNTKLLRILLDKDANVNAIARDNTTPLDYAAATGNPEMVQLLLNYGVDVNVNLKDSAGDTAIMYAAYGTGQDRQQVYQLLMKHNADVNVMNNLGETTLFFVSRSGGDDERLAEFLIQKGAHSNHSNIKGETPLHYAAKSGYKKLGELFIKNGADINAKNNESQTPLHYAVKYGQIEFAELLINHGADVTVEDENHNTAQHLAVEEALGHVKILELLTRGDDVNKFNKNGKSLLHLSIEKGGDMKTFKWLLNKGANTNAIDSDGFTLLHSAARYGRKDIMEWLMKHHPVDEIINKQDNYGNAPLHFAVRGGHYDLTKILLSNGSDVNAMNYDFEFPIHFAAKTGREDLIKLLIKYDATVNVRDRIDWSPLFYAVLNGNERVVKLLINHEDEDFSQNDMDAQGKSVFHVCAEKGSVNIGKMLYSHGADISAVDELGHTPLHRVSAFGNSEFVEWLIDLLSDTDQGKSDQGVNVIDNDGKTPLHLAAEKGYESVVRTLLARNADINLKDKSKNTALSLAILNGHRNIAKILLKHSTRPNVKYGENKELLLLATEKGYDDIVELLINKKGNVDAQDENNWTPLHIAAKNGYMNIAQTLLSHGAKVDLITSNNQTAIMIAIQNGNYDVVEELLKNNADTSISDELANQQSAEVAVNLLTKYDKQRKEDARIFHIFILVIFALLVPLMCFIAIFFHKLCRKEATDSMGGLKLTDLLERYMFPQSQVMLSSRVGKSVFGLIYKGYAHKILPCETETLVAIKVIKGGPKETGSLTESQKMLLSLGSELRVLMQCGGHMNLVNLLGIVTENIASHELMVIVEYCRYGNLKDVLEKHHKNVKSQNFDSNIVQMSKSRATVTSAVSVTGKNLASWSHQVAQGMQFLASHRIVHGNLAARSILLADGNIAKICNFGLARAMYKTDAYISEKEGKLEYKWLAVEAMQHRIMTTKSDVWSFGILLWELFSFGETPYQDIEIYQLKRHIMNGYTMEKPPYADDNMYGIMQHCWRLNPESRPSFDSLEKWLYQFV